MLGRLFHRVIFLGEKYFHPKKSIRNKQLNRLWWMYKGASDISQPPNFIHNFSVCVIPLFFRLSWFLWQLARGEKLNQLIPWLFFLSKNFFDIKERCFPSLQIYTSSPFFWFGHLKAFCVYFCFVFSGGRFVLSVRIPSTIMSLSIVILLLLVLFIRVKNVSKIDVLLFTCL